MNKAVPGTGGQAPVANRDQVHVNLLGLGPRLREHAARQGVSVGCAARTAISRMLEDEADAAATDADRPQAPDEDDDRSGKTRLLLRVSSARAEALAGRARACGVSRSRYVEMLMDGAQPAALPVNHAAMVAAMMASTDYIAVLGVDLKVFLRLLGTAPTAELEPYRARMRSLIEDVRAHLKPAAELLAALEATRRWR